MKNWIEMLWAWLIVKLGYRYDESKVPKDTPYCYSIDWEKREAMNDDVLYTNCCPYYSFLSENIRGCKLCGVIADDFLLWDQCKICGISDNP